MNVTNKYLKSSLDEISNFIENNTKPPEDMMDNFILELKVSRLLLPVVFDGMNISFPHIEVDDGTNLLPLFTDHYELKKYSTDFEPISMEIAFYIDIVEDLELDGAVIDLKSSEFCVRRETLNKVPRLNENREFLGLDGPALKEMAFKKTDGALKSFVSEESNFNKFEKLEMLLARSQLLNSVVSLENLEVFARDGIIDRYDTGGFVFYTHDSGRESYGVVFTDIESMVAFHENLEYYYYAQVTNKYRVFNYALTNDLDGIIINPGTDDYYVPRQVLLRLYDDDLIDLDLEDATRFAFIID